MSFSESTVLGPLTTSFTPPTHCATAIAKCLTCSRAWGAQFCAGETQIKDDPSCWPPRVENIKTPYPVGAWGVYSPGIMCPNGYTTACSHDGSQSRGDFNFYWPPQAIETAIGCCPIGYGCGRPEAWGQTCTSTITLGSVPTASCSNGVINGATTQPFPFTYLSQSTIMTMSALEIHMPLIQLVYQASDLDDVASTKTIETAPNLDLTSVVFTTPINTAPTAELKHEPAALTNGQVAGIAVGATIAGMVLIGFFVGVLCFGHCRRQQAAEVGQRPRTTSTIQSQQDEMAVAELAHKVVDCAELHQAGKNYGWELEAQRPPAELDSLPGKEARKGRMRSLGRKDSATYREW